MKRLMLLVLFVLLSVSALGFEEILLEITVQYLDGKIKWQEVIDAIDDGDVLLPLSQISNALELDVSFDRANDSFSVSFKDNPKSFTASGYNDLPLLAEKKPLELDNDYYVHVGFLDSVLEMTHLYDPLKSSLIIVLSYPSPKIEQTREGTIDLEIEAEKPFEAPLSPFRFSSFEYQLEKTYRKDSSQNDGQFYLHFRTGLAEISTGITLENTRLKNPYFLLTYEQNNLLFKLGHTAFTSQTRLGNTSLLGLIFIKPYPTITRKYPVIDLEIQGKKGDVAVVFINNSPAKKIELTSDEPELVLLPLKPYRYQVITVENAKLISQKTYYNGISFLEKGEAQTCLYAGYFGKKRFERLGELVEFSYSRGLTENSDFNAAFVWQKKDVLESPLLRFDLKTELFNGFSLASIFYLNGLGQTGGEFSLISTFKTGYLEFSYYNRPKQILAYYKKPVNKGVTVSLEKDFSTSLRLQATTGVSLKTESTPLLRFFLASASLSFAKPLSRFSLSYGQNESYIAPPEKILLTDTFTFSYSLALPRFNLNAKYTDQSLVLDTLSWNQKQLGGKLTFSIGNFVFFNNETILSSENKNSLSGSNEMQLNANLTRTLCLTGTLSLEGTIKPSYQLDNQTNGLGLSFYLGPPFWEFRVQRNLGQRGNYTEYSGKVTIGNQKTKFSLNAALRETEKKLLENTFKLLFNHTFTNGFTAGIRYEKLASTPYSNTQERIGSISISHGVSFTSKGILGHKYTGEDLASSVSGVVFLDLNGNGVKDEREPGIEKIEMKLGPQTVLTNKDGFFMFSTVSSKSYLFGFNPEKLTADYVAPLLNFPINIRNGDHIVFDMPLTMNGVVKGRVFIDTNLDTIFNEKDIVLDWVNIKIEELDKQTFSDKSGNYYIENLPLGTFTVKVDPKSIPLGLSPGEPKKAYITPDSLDCILDIPLVY